MKQTKLLSLVLALCMVLSLGAFASSDMPDTSMGGKATSSPPDNSTRAIDILGSRAAIYYAYGEDGYTVSENITDAYTVELQQEPEAPAVGASAELGGLYIECASVDWDEENTVGNSGLIINALTDTETTFLLGGSEDYYEAPDGAQYNSVIVMNADENETLPESATETAPGCGIGFNGKSLELKNVYVESNSSGRPSIHIPASTRDKNVSQLSDIVCVDSTVVNHSTRAMLLMGGDVWFLNSRGITDSWGALSYDNTSTTMYVVNSLSENTGSGYSIYDAAGCTAYVYGSRVVAGGTGITVCRTATLTIDSLENASEVATAPYDGESELLVPAATADGRTDLIAYDYPIKIHADMSGADSVATAYLNNSYISSQAEDVVLSDGSVYEPAAGDGISGRISDYQSGALVFIACHNGKVVFDGCELNSRTGVLVHSMFTYDSMASGIYPVDGTEYAGDEVVFANMAAEGDVLHEDYMRKMVLSLENAELTGKVVGTTLAGWNSYWTAQVEELAAAAGGEASEEPFDTEAALLQCIYNDSYETLWGVRMSMDAGSVWNVTGDSNLYSFTMEEGAVVQAAEGCTMTIYVDCGMDNALEAYDTSVGTQIDAFEPGVEYSGVVILVEGGASDEAPAAAGGNWDAWIAYLNELLDTDPTLDIYDMVKGELATAQQSDYIGMEDGTVFGVFANLYDATPYEEFAGGDAAAAAGGDTSEAAYQEYLHAWLQEEDAGNDTMTEDIVENEFMPLIYAGDYETFPAEMLWNGMLNNGSPMTYDEWVASVG